MRSNTRSNMVTGLVVVACLAALGAFIYAMVLISQPQMDKGYVYTSVQQCVAGKVFTPSYCQQTHNQAQQLAQRNAPKYKSRSDCEHDWGKSQCTATSDGRRQYVPMFTAWFLYANNLHKGPVPLYTDDSEGHASLSTNKGDHLSASRDGAVTVDDSVVSDGAHSASVGDVHTSNVQDHPVVNEDHPAPPEVHDPVEVHPVVVDR